MVQFLFVYVKVRNHSRQNGNISLQPIGNSSVECVTPYTCGWLMLQCQFGEVHQANSRKYNQLKDNHFRIIFYQGALNLSEPILAEIRFAIGYNQTKIIS